MPFVPRFPRFFCHVECKIIRMRTGKSTLPWTLKMNKGGIFAFTNILDEIGWVKILRESLLRIRLKTHHMLLRECLDKHIRKTKLILEKLLKSISQHIMEFFLNLSPGNSNSVRTLMKKLSQNYCKWTSHAFVAILGP